MKKAVLFIHGFSALREDNQYFIEEIKKHQNIDLHTFILPGHDTRIMGRVKYQDWQNAAETELKKMLEKYNQITIVAHSMGCVLAVRLAANYSEVKKLVLIAPGFKLGSREQIGKDFKNLVTKNVDNNIGTGFEGILRKFLTVPITRVIEYRKLVEQNKDLLNKVKCPTLILHGTKDNIVSINTGLKVFDILDTNKEFTILEDVRHQIFKSNKKSEITNYIYKYILGGIHFKKKDII